jgi:CBS-domain-containing membrane protein
MEHVAVAEAPRVELTRRLTECTTYVKRTLNQYNQDFKAISFKHEATPLTAIAGSCVTLGGLQKFQAFVKLSQPQSMILIGSTAAVSTLLFAAPAAPLGIPYNTICGHCVSVAIAVLFHWLQELIGMDLVANVYAPSLAIGAMAMLKVSNPPAAAACFIFVTSAKAQAQPLRTLPDRSNRHRRSARAPLSRPQRKVERD